MNHEAFLYLWYDAPNKKYYLGKHKGSPDDGYTHSSTVWESFTKNNIPKGVRRRILAYGTDEEMCILEHKLLVNRRKRCWDRYYNRSLGNPSYVDISGENHHFYGVSKEDHPLYGRRLSEETKKKLSIAHTGKKVTEETKKKLRIVRQKQLNDEEYLKKWKAAMVKREESYRGENNPFYGRRHSEEIKKKISETKKKQYANGEAIHPSTYAKKGKENRSYKHGKLVNAKNDPEVRRAYKAEWYQRKKMEKKCD